MCVSLACLQPVTFCGVLHLESWVCKPGRDYSQSLQTETLLVYVKQNGGKLN